MCGINGIVRFDKQLNEYRFYKEYMESLVHRGKDDEGFVLINSKTKKFKECSGNNTMKNIIMQNIDDVDLRKFNMIVHHNRLSIIDLSEKGHQPMYYNDKWMVFNGEIYNYIELREELKKIGYNFVSDSDSEVLLKSYDCWGIDAFNKFNGEWAIAIYDIKNNELLLCRDRYGIKPLYYFKTGDTIYFSSELKAFRFLDEYKFDMNHYVVYKYLSFGVKNQGDDSFWKGINSIKAAEILIFKKNYVKNVKYYRIERNYIKINNDKKVIDKFTFLFKDSIKLRLRSDIEIGACLSGGLDSSSIVSILKVEENRDINTFTAKFDNFKYDESKYVLALKEKLSLKNKLININIEKYSKYIDDVIYCQDEPFVNPSIFAQWMVMKLANENNINLLMDGQGGDEVLGGYGKFQIPYLIEKKMMVNRKEYYNYLLLAKNPRLIQFVKNNSQLLNERNNKENLKKYLNEQYYYLKQLQNIPIFKREIIKTIEMDILPQLLHYVDRNAMNFEIEGRYPFLDHRIVNYMSNVSGSVQRKNNEFKYVLKNSINTLIPEIRNRKDKIGFFVPQKEWIIFIKDSICNEFMRIPEEILIMLNIHYISILIKQLKINNLSYKETNEVWMIYNLIKWYKNYKKL